MHDIQDDVDEDGTNSIEESIKETGLRYEQIDTRLDIILQEEVSGFRAQHYQLFSFPK